MRFLVTGGVRSGKSRHAEDLLATRDDVAYVACGPARDDPDWATRIELHRARRPESWSTVETRDLAEAIGAAAGPVLVDCLGTWLTGVIDDRHLWEAPAEAVADVIDSLVDDFVAALDSAGDDVVIVSNEVGWGVVPAHRSGRLFRDLLGTINQRVAEHCDEVHLVVSGRVLIL